MRSKLPGRFGWFRSFSFKPASLLIPLLTLAFLLLGAMTAHAQEGTPTTPTGEPTSTAGGMAPESWIYLPTMPANATQADYGKQLYILVCQACHGDKGRGLTSEWISQWNPKDQNCWQSKCHATNHPPDGFTLPIDIPPVMGADALTQFKTANDLYQYIRMTMPWQDPGHMLDKEYWQVTAFLLQANQIGDPSIVLSAENASQIVLRTDAAPAATEVTQQDTQQPEPISSHPSTNTHTWLYLLFGVAGLLLLVLIAYRFFIHH